MNVTINEELCTGCGLCVDTCPELFDMEDTVAMVKIDIVPEDLEESCKEAAENCPVEAIII